MDSNQAALELLVAAIEAAGYRPGDDVAICLDPAVGCKLRAAHRLFSAAERS